MKPFVFYAITSIAIGGVALAQQAPAPKADLPPEQQPAASSGPRRLTVNVSVAEPDDLKVAEGNLVSFGYLLADRSRERQCLEAQSNQLQLTLQRLDAAIITQPQPPCRSLSSLPCQTPAT
ncbi:MAG: hypothetical protein AAFZ17_03135 [Cyanobacteria bacterium J06650_10]